jgi:hypothetical protein
MKQLRIYKPLLYGCKVETAAKCGEVQVAEFSRESGLLLGRCAQRNAMEFWPWR